MKSNLESDLQQLTGLLGELSNHARDNLEGAGEALLNRLNLVTREEFETQRALVTALHERLAALEKRVDAVVRNGASD